MADTTVSKNMFELLGNDPEPEDSGPVQTVERNKPRTGPRGAEPQAPTKPVGYSGNRRGGLGGNDGAFRDRDAGSGRNHTRSTEEQTRGPRGGGRGARGRGGRGGRFDHRDDKIPRASPHGGSDKQAAHGWGANEGGAEKADEDAGEDIAQKEKKEAEAEDAAPLTPAEPEDNSISYADYLAQQAEKKLALGELNVRQANEGSKPDEDWGKAISKDEEEDYFPASVSKKQRQRAEKPDNKFTAFDPRILEPAPRSPRDGPRPQGRGRGGGDRGGRGRGGDRGGDRGGRGRGGARGGAREGNTTRGPISPINAQDESAFPSLGSK